MSCIPRRSNRLREQKPALSVAAFGSLNIDDSYVSDPDDSDFIPPRDSDSDTDSDTDSYTDGDSERDYENCTEEDSAEDNDESPV